MKKIIQTLLSVLLIAGLTVPADSFAKPEKKGERVAKEGKAAKQGKKEKKADSQEKKKGESQKDDADGGKEAGKGVSFGNLKDGQKVKSPVKVKMNVSGKKVVPAGDPSPDSGHHHLIIDGSHIEKGKVVPADSKHIHFGLAQTEADVTLEKGKHTLTLQFADKDHISFGKKWSETITIEVE